VWQVTLKRDIEEETCEQMIIDHNLSTNTDKQRKMICSMLNFLQNVKEIESSNEYIQLMLDHLRLLNTTATNEICDSNDSEQSKLKIRLPKTGKSSGFYKRCNILDVVLK
jgi:hypothetical protein